MNVLTSCATAKFKRNEIAYACYFQFIAFYLFIQRPRGRALRARLGCAWEEGTNRNSPPPSKELSTVKSLELCS